MEEGFWKGMAYAVSISAAIFVPLILIMMMYLGVLP